MIFRIQRDPEIREGLATTPRTCTTMRVDRRLFRLLGLLFLCLPPTPALADAIMLTRAMSATTIAEFFVGEASVRVELEVGGADLRAFRKLLPDELHEELGLGSEALSDRVPEFFSEDLVIRTGPKT